MNTDLTLAETSKLHKLLATAVRVTLESSGTAEAARFAEMTDAIWSALERQDRLSYVCLKLRGFGGVL